MLAEVADDLCILLTERIVGVTTFIRLSAICKSWYMVATATKWCNITPWLMLAKEEDSEWRDFYDHSSHKIYQLASPQARGMKNIGSIDRWIITGSLGGPFHLLNPLTGMLIDLPPSIAFEKLDFLAFKLTPKQLRDVVPIKATCSQLGSDGSCIVALTHLGFCLSFCKPGYKKWLGYQLCESLEFSFVRGAFYIVNYLLQVFLIDFMSTEGFTKIVDIPLDVCKGLSKSYIMECAGKLLVVVRGYAFVDESRFIIGSFRVFQLDVEDKKVVKLKGIGNYALFLGAKNSICLLVTVNLGRIFKRNCIYFTYDRYGKVNARKFELGEDMGVYNLEDGSITPHYPGVSKSLYSFPIWVTVNPFQ